MTRIDSNNGFEFRVSSFEFRAVLFVSAFFFVMSINAQDQKEKWGEGEIQKVEVVIEKDREVTVPQASRNFEKVPPRPVDTSKPEVTYQFKNLSFNTPDFTPTLRPLKLKSEPISKIYSNYIALGFGNYISPYGEAYITNKRNKSKYYGLKLYHRSFINGPVDNGNSGSGNSEVRLFGKTMTNQIALGGFVDYQNTVAHFYGYQPGESVSSSSIRQSYNVFSLGGDIENSKKSDFTYNFKAGYSYLKDHYSASENEVNLNFASAYKLGKNKRLVIDADYFLIDRKDSEVASKMRQIFKAKPAFQFEAVENLSLLVGANVAYENDTINKQNKVHIYPNVVGNYSLSPSVNVYAALTGDVDKVSLHSLSQENVWLNSNVGIFNTNRAFDFSGGLRGKIGNKVSFAAGFSFATLKNYYYYQTDTGAIKQAKFNVFYDNASTHRTNFYGEVGYSMSKFKMNARADYFAYSSNIANQVATTYSLGKSFSSGALQRPSYRIAVNASYNIYDKFLIEAGLITQGGIKALNIETKNLITLPAAVDLNVKVNYFVSKQFSVFLNGNNILSSNYQLYMNYPVRGLQLLGGASYSF